MQLLTALEDLTIFSCGELRLSESDMQGLSNLRRLSLGSLPKLLEIPQGLQQAAGTLKSLYVGHCVGLAALPEWLGDFTSLQRLTLCDCPNLTSLPESMRRLTALKELHIIKCPELSRRCKQGGEDWPNVAHVSGQSDQIDESTSDTGTDLEPQDDPFRGLITCTKITTHHGPHNPSWTGTKVALPNSRDGTG
ncbi:hypothetical protein RJ639_015161 [Escallonia herrerae]|uniref:R13L1/DRL21-like LRR repeat region domain-containing protein n=1 Tax=Escallonia herrerae TaxID=1293975 RepID=A0AA88VLW2_9ASTE|nr:hypothetical protein RJ639_015161 [Escallonia herrerae]